ncbi:putative feruloyl esterase B-1 [Lachnellula hyalina]|uniref:Carboxylic ester hydrolase n=1 Tax=Lachnellula hyalina TaxID=1316788 RepID=A0A8H8R2T3_9HELO|nr:putative feruloyl esterase B-1 [Lachnellula hyalina]TVY27482.1 putative feruloyl esterase B-1 [Lachnellula hyalina]
MRTSSVFTVSCTLLVSYIHNVAAALNCSKAAFVPHLPANTTILSATVVASNGSYGGGSQDKDFPKSATGLPALCAVQLHVNQEHSSYMVGVFLPSNATYNGRFMTTGNTGFGGGINWPAMGTFVQYGFASMSTGSGHNSGAGDASWAINNTEALTDWGYRAMHGSVVVAKEIVAAYYGSSAQYSYYSACSGGGRQGLKEVQLYPEDFDGVVAGSPPWWLTHLHTWVVQIGMWNLPESGKNRIPPYMFLPIKHEIYRQCDPQDGQTDGIISDPYSCNFSSAALACSSTNSTNCLHPAALDTLNTLYSDWRDPSGNFLFPPFALGADYSGLTKSTSAPSGFGTDFVADMVMNDANWNWTTFNTSIVEKADRLNPGGANADDFDLSSFQSRGGKLIHYHGLSDSLIPAGSSILFREKVAEAMRSTSLDDFYRMFLIPGMGHCRNSDLAPWYIAGGGQTIASSSHSVPGFSDAQHDVVLAIMDWVEKGDAPDSLIATKFLDDKDSTKVVNQRPICAYPSQAQYVGSGNMNESSNWACQAGKSISIPEAKLGH